MTTPFPAPNQTASSSQLGPLIGEYRGSAWRLVYALFAVVALYLALSGTIGNIEFDTGFRIFWAVVAIAGIVQTLFGLGARAELYERGFIISRAGKTITGRWEDIAKVSHKVSRSYIFGVIPEPWKSHEITITLTNRQQVIVYSSYFQHAEQMGDTIQRKWAEARRSIQGSAQ